MPTKPRLVRMAPEQIQEMLNQIADETALLSEAELIDLWHEAEAAEFAEG